MCTCMIYFLCACACAHVRPSMCSTVHTHRTNVSTQGTHTCIYAYTRTHTHSENKSMLKVVMPTQLSLPSGALAHLCTEFFKWILLATRLAMVLHGSCIMPHKCGNLNYHLDPTHRSGGFYQNLGGQICYHDILAWGKIAILWSDCESWKGASAIAAPPAHPSLIMTYSIMNHKTVLLPLPLHIII